MNQLRTEDKPLKSLRSISQAPKSERLWYQQ